MERFIKFIDSLKTNFDTHEHKSSNQAYELLSSFLIHSEDAILIINPNGIVMQVNPAFEKLYGWTQEELAGKEVPFECHMEEVRDLITRIKNGEKISSYKTTRKNKYAQSLDVSITLSAIRNEQGDIVAISSFIRDIGEQVKAQSKLNESRSKYRSLFKYCPDAIFSLDNKGKILEVNPITESLCETSKEFLIHSNFLEWVHNEDIDYFIEQYQETLKGQSNTYDLKIITRMGSEKT
ncbi:hypothetical protein Q73_14115 [Bacillus coahuilensis m2-6]|uniref:PAS domain-containing protein n=1 Tax=Bacillus coahuilensis TaxID=408580 RepID=UPI0007504A9D|nr:PAS domain S-box protein [Bacillus coahuilensis]KUP04969.1 hypothetical protein Q73_14115 [Bacillus coahuilensis m2-6]